MLALLTTGASAAAAIVYLAHKGNYKTNWFAICQQFNSFCQRTSGSLIGSFGAVVLFILLILLSAMAFSRRWLMIIHFNNAIMLNAWMYFLVCCVQEWPYNRIMTSVSYVLCFFFVICDNVSGVKFNRTICSFRSEMEVNILSWFIFAV